MPSSARKKITSCSVTMMLFLHLEVKPLMTLTTVLYFSCALISGHLAMMLIELTKRPYASFLLSLHDALPICSAAAGTRRPGARWSSASRGTSTRSRPRRRSEEHTSELQSHSELVCRHLLEKK